MDKSTQKIRIIQAGAVRVEFNLEAGWVAIVPHESQPEPGVTFDAANLDAVIVALGAVRTNFETVALSEKSVGEVINGETGHEGIWTS